MIPMVEYSGKTMRSIPGRPTLTPFTMSQIFLAFSITSSLVCNRGMGYWKTQTPTVSSDEEIYTARARTCMYVCSCVHKSHAARKGAAAAAIEGRTRRNETRKRRRRRRRRKNKKSEWAKLNLNKRKVTKPNQNIEPTSRSR